MKQNKSIFYILIIILLCFSIYGTWSLVHKEWLTGEACPKILNIPACYIIFSIMLIMLFTHITNSWHRLYFMANSLALSIAAFATLGQLLGWIQCPKTPSGIPMCYISFAIFLSLLFLKLSHTKRSKLEL